jgi:hypothetical protein
MGSNFNGAASSMRVSAVLGSGSIVFTGPTGFAASFVEGFNGVTISDAAVGVVTVTTAISAGAGTSGGAGNGTVARVIGFGNIIGAGFEALGRS